MTDNTQIMITVKKTDGSTERISLAELKKRQGGKGSFARVQDDSKVVRDDKPLLHEVAPESAHAKTTAVASRGDQISKIVDSLSFKVSPQLDNRLRSVIQLRLKDIRSEADTLDAGARSIKDGGLGLTEIQAKELTEKSQPAVYIPKVEKKPVKENKENVVDKIIAASGQPSASIENLISKVTTTAPHSNVSPLRTPSATPSRTMMHDVKTKPLSMGPLDEIQFFSLVDFRRLSSRPVDAAERLKQKFLNLKAESYLLFVSSWDAWHNSLLYQDYVKMVDIALSQKRPLASVLGEKDQISLAEIEALINLEKDLGI